MSGAAAGDTFPAAPRVLRTERLVLRAYEIRHAPLLLDAISTSLDALGQWTPWIIPDPFEVATLEARLAGFRQKFDNRTAFIYAVMDPAEALLIGHAGLFGRVGPDALEAGYFIRSDMTGRGYATEAAAVLVDTAFDSCGVSRVEMHCDVENHASIAVPLRLGFREARRFEDGGRTLMVLSRGR